MFHAVRDCLMGQDGDVPWTVKADGVGTIFHRAVGVYARYEWQIPYEIHALMLVFQYDGMVYGKGMTTGEYAQFLLGPEETDPDTEYNAATEHEWLPTGNTIIDSTGDVVKDSLPF